MFASFAFVASGRIQDWAKPTSKMNYLFRGANKVFASVDGAKITMCIVFNLNVIRQNTYQDLYSLAKNPFSYFSPPLIIKIVNICSD